jgi:hypothetical protein
MLAQFAIFLTLQRDQTRVYRKDVSEAPVRNLVLRPPIVIPIGPMPKYEIREISLGAASDKSVRPYALNNRGDLIGTYDAQVGSGRPVLVTAKGPAWFLDFSGVPQAIDESSNIGAILFGEDGNPSTYIIWSPRVGSQIEAPDKTIRISAVNAHGDWVGSGPKPIDGPEIVPAKRFLKGRLTDLQPLPGYRHSYGSMIANDGSVIGISSGGSPLMTVTLWPPNKMPEKIATPEGFDIYDHLLHSPGGSVTGTCKPNRDQLRFGYEGTYAFVTRKGVSKLIPFPCEVQGSVPFAINRNGDIVGEAFVDHKGTRRAWLYRDGATYFLDDIVRNSSSWKTVSAFCINDKGVVAGVGNRFEVGTKGFLMTERGKA